jgi:signal transduction histidine kinase
MSILPLFHPQDRGAATDAMHDIQAGLLDSARAESRCLNKDDQVIWIHHTISLIGDLNQQPLHFILTMENVTLEKEAANELEEMKRRLQWSIEAERLRLAQEIHDGPMQDLYGAVFKLNSLRGLHTHLPDSEDVDTIKETEDLLKEVAGRLRLICGELRPPTLSNLGLESAIRSHVDRLAERTPGLGIELKLEPDDHRLPDELRLQLYRVYQQLLSNILRHAEASQASIQLLVKEDRVELAVQDNGRGFQPPEKMVDLIREGHYGLAGIAERVRALNGELQIQSQPGAGTRVQVSVPFEQTRPTNPSNQGIGS